MGERENTLEIVESYFERADEKLKSAKILLEKQMFDDSIGRSYYATYLAVRALLLFIGETPKTYSGLITTLD